MESVNIKAPDMCKECFILSCIGCSYFTPSQTGHDVFQPIEIMEESIRDYNVGDSDYAFHKIQPWDIWLEYKLNPWDADIVKRVLRNKESTTRKMDYEKIIHICKERIRQIEETDENSNRY